MPPPVLHPETTVPEPIAKPPDLNHSKAEVRKLLSGGGYGTDPKVVSLTVTLKTIPILPTPPLPTTASIIVSLPNPKNTSAVLPISALELARKTTDKDKKGHIASKGYVEAKLTAATSPKENVSKRRARQTRSTRSNKKDHNLDKQSTVKDKGPWAPRKPNQVPLVSLGKSGNDGTFLFSSHLTRKKRPVVRRVTDSHRPIINHLKKRICMKARTVHCHVLLPNHHLGHPRILRVFSGSQTPLQKVPYLKRCLW